jgi:hypothetical protein
MFKHLCLFARRSGSDDSLYSFGHRFIVPALVVCWSMSLVSSPLFAGGGNAYWRHDEGPAGSLVPDGPNTLHDSSDSGNHMQTFSSANPPNTAAMYTDNVSPLPLKSGLENNFSLDFGPNFGGGGLNNDNYTAGKTGNFIQSHVYEAMTIEMAFNVNTLVPGEFYTLFGRDGRPLDGQFGLPDSPLPPLAVMVRGDDFPNNVPNQLFVEWIDGNAGIGQLASGFSISPGSWYHMAFTLTDTDAELWIAGETGDYQLVDAISGANFAGEFNEVLFWTETSFTMGRGMFDGNFVNWADALIDEVRVTTYARTPDEFLFETGVGPIANADFDGDGVVDGSDFLTWQRGFGAPGSLVTGDADGDGFVDGADLTIWENQFGGSPTFAAVPEPGTFALTVLAAGALAFYRRRNPMAG